VAQTSQDEFTEVLRREGHQNVVVVEREPNGALDLHSHPFASRALILAGEIELIVDGRSNTYRPGEVFVLRNGEMHAERYGAAGVRYLVGRK